uniref:Uncharacterized protein n=1 Tax=Oryza nivara TaxID=4536 RepID=A0A0E0G5Y4_ORYNI
MKILLMRIGGVGNRGRKPCRAVWPADDGDAVWHRSPPWRRHFRLPLSFPNHILRVKTLLPSERAVAAIHVASSLGAPLWRNLFVQGLSMVYALASNFSPRL